ncbi:MAG TPA: single-stranded DNA-binding protein [bacterium]|nr:single-stranded DNA-binding protein [bacterium]
MASFNRVILMGNLTRDPELRYTGGGTAVCSLSLAVNRRVKKGDRWEEEASFFDIVVFGKIAENSAEYLAKGRPVLVEGELVQRRWDDQEGRKRSKVEVVANTVQFLGGRGDSAGGSGGGSRAGGPAGKSDSSNDGPPPIEDDEIPF